MNGLAVAEIFSCIVGLLFLIVGLSGIIDGIVFLLNDGFSAPHHFAGIERMFASPIKKVFILLGVMSLAIGVLFVVLSGKNQQ